MKAQKAGGAYVLTAFGFDDRDTARRAYVSLRDATAGQEGSGVYFTDWEKRPIVAIVEVNENGNGHRKGAVPKCPGAEVLVASEQLQATIMRRHFAARIPRRSRN